MEKRFDLDWFKERLASADKFGDFGVENWFGMGDVRRLVSEVEQLQYREREQRRLLHLVLSHGGGISAAELYFPEAKEHRDDE